MILTTSQLADLLGLTERRVNQLASESVLNRVSPGKFDGATSIQSYIKSISAKAESKAAALDADKELARLRKEQADALEMKNAITRRELIPAEDVEREWSDIVRKIRSGVLAMTSRIRGQISFLDATHGEIINRECNLVLEELADDRD